MPPNDYYTAPTDETPITTIRSSVENSDRAALETGFDLLPDVVDVKRSQYGADVSTVATLYAITIDEVVGGAYYEGLEIVFEAVFANTGVATIQLNGGVIADLVDAVGSPLVVGAIQVGQMVTAIYSSATNFKVSITDSASASALSAAASAVAAAASAADAEAAAQPWEFKNTAFVVGVSNKYSIDGSSGAVDGSLPASVTIGDVIIVHNESISTNTVRLTNTALTIKGPDGTITSSDNLVLEPGDTVHMIAKTTLILEVV